MSSWKDSMVARILTAPKGTDLWQNEQQLTATYLIPELAPEEALRTYYEVRRKHYVVYVDKNGNRCVWGSPIELFELRAPRPSPRLYKTVRNKFLVPRKPITCKDVDRPLPVELAAALQHTSEKGWNLPQDHPHHLLNLPQGILDSITHFAVAPKAGDPLAPRAITSLYKQNLQLKPTYFSGLSDPTLAAIKTQDEVGPLTKYQYVYRGAIDASLLRSCKRLFLTGINQLYSQRLTFMPTTPHHYHCQPTLNTVTREIYDPAPFLPMALSQQDIDTIATQLRNQVHITELPGWVLHSEFLRFLHLIGPENCLRLKDLRFAGKVKRHICGTVPGCKRGDLNPLNACKDNVIATVKSCLPFIKALCPSVETLIITAEGDRWVPLNYWRHGALRYHDSEVLDGLEDVLSQVKGLKKFILHGDFVKKEAYLESFEVMDRVEAKGKLAIRKNVQAGTLVKNAVALGAVGEEGPKCDFCHGDHVWAECYNLCSYCGASDHQRDRCLKAALQG